MGSIILVALDVFVDSLSGVLNWLVIGAITFVLDLYRRFRKLRADVDNLDRYMTGDSDDPGAPGILEKVDKVDDEICGLRTDMEEHQRTTEVKLDKIIAEPHQSESESQSRSPDNTNARPGPGPTRRWQSQSRPSSYPTSDRDRDRDRNWDWKRETDDRDNRSQPQDQDDR